MTPSDFKKGFSAFEIAMYKDWKRHSHLENNLGSKFEYTLKNPIEQELIISLDQTTQRMIPKGCEKTPQDYYAIYLFKANKMIDQLAIPYQIGYGHIFKKTLPPGNYELIVKNWENGDPMEFEADFRVTSYTSKEEVKIWETVAYIEDDMELCL